MPPIMHPQHVRLLYAAMIPARERQRAAEASAEAYAEWCQFHDEDTAPDHLMWVCFDDQPCSDCDGLHGVAMPADYFPPATDLLCGGRCSVAMAPVWCTGNRVRMVRA